MIRTPRMLVSVDAPLTDDQFAKMLVEMEKQLATLREAVRYPLRLSSTPVEYQYMVKAAANFNFSCFGTRHRRGVHRKRKVQLRRGRKPWW